MARLNASDPFARHRLALQLALGAAGAADLATLAESQNRPASADFLTWHKLAPVCALALERRGELDDLPPTLRDALRQERRGAAASYLAQAAVLGEIDRLLTARGITYAVFKGAHVRELAYADPSLRLAGDIDVLVAPDQRLPAAEALIAAGFAPALTPENLSHEATFSRAGVDIDLHWDILRPGRTRCDIVAALLASRRRVGAFWGLSDTDAAFLMLVHPAFAKYVTSPNAALVTVVDFLSWCDARRVDWQALASRLDDTGLKTAAWTVLTWFRMLAPGPLAVPDDFVACIAPGRLRARYLAHWLKHDLATRWLDRPLAIQAGLTLALHDRPSDVVTAIRGWSNGRRAAVADPLLALAGAART